MSTALTPLAHILTGILCLTTLALLLLFGLILGRIGLSFPCNHWGFDIRLGFPLAGVHIGLCAGVLSWYEKKKGVQLALLLGLLCTLLVFIADHWNLLVVYELWIERGFPAMWELSPHRR